MDNFHANKELKIKNFDIIILNYVEDSKKEQLINELTQLYGQYEPIEFGNTCITPLSEVPKGLSPDELFNKKVTYYDGIDQLQKPLPDKIEYFEIRIIKRISSWNEVVCRGRLKEKYLKSAKDEFLENLSKKKCDVPELLKVAHTEFEEYLSPHIMDNIMHKSDSEKRKTYPYLYLGENEELSATDIMSAIEETDCTRYGIGWCLQSPYSLINGYLVIENSGIHTGLISAKRCFSLLSLTPTNMPIPNPHGEIMGRKFKAVSYEYEIINEISLILLINILLEYRLERIKGWHKNNAQYWYQIQNVLINKNRKDYLNCLLPLQTNISKQQSFFLQESFNIRSEFRELVFAIRIFKEYLLKKNRTGDKREQAFSDTIKDNGNQYTEIQKMGPVLKLVENSEIKIEELRSQLHQADEEQKTLTSHISDIVNLSLQTRMEKLNTSMTILTVVVLILTVVQIIISYGKQ